MREIKFRAKRIDNGSWVYGDYFKTPLTDENSGTKPDVGWFFLTGELRHCIGQNNAAFVVDTKTLGQFTGLLDKNGKEIYEGDILKVGNSDGIDGQDTVEWDNDGWVPFNYDTCTDWTHVLSYEVIGNIYENPELVKW